MGKPWANELMGQSIDGRYRIERLLGAGGTGAVFVARHLTLNSDVALKLLSPKRKQDDTVLARFRQEAEFAASVAGDGIIQVRDFGLDDVWGPFMVMELVDGEALDERLARGPLPLVDLACVGGQILETLGKVHAQGILHRDLKPANIFLANTPEGPRAKLFDFGIARLVENDAKLTEEGVAVGTPQYMAPEQAHAKRDLDYRVDLYAVGAILYHAVSGRRPFGNLKGIDLLKAVVKREYAPVREVAPYAPAALCEVIERAMAENRDARFESAASMAHALHAAVASLEGPDPMAAGRVSSTGATPDVLHQNMAPQPMLQQATHEPAAVRRQSPMGLWIAAAVALCVVGGLGATGAFLYAHQDTESSPTSPPPLVASPQPNTNTEDSPSESGGPPPPVTALQDTALQDTPPPPNLSEGRTPAATVDQILSGPGFIRQGDYTMCASGEHTLERLSLASTQDALIIAETCTVTLRGCNLRSSGTDARALVVTGNAILDGCTLESQDGPAITLGGNGRLTLRTSTARGKVGIQVTGESRLEVSDASIHGREHAVFITGVAEATLERTYREGEIERFGSSARITENTRRSSAP